MVTGPVAERVPGDVAGGPGGAVAVCTLTLRALARRLGDVPGVALAGPLMTANLGIEEMVRAILARPGIRLLVVCGNDSPLFRQGRSLVALVRHGISPEDHRIVGAPGYLPYLPGLSVADVEAFRQQVELVDWIGRTEPVRLAVELADLARSRRPAPRPARIHRVDGGGGFTRIQPGGRRTPLAEAGEGFFVIVADRAWQEIVVRHYRPDLRPGHEMRGRRAESMLLGLLRSGLVADPAHAGYLGAELTKAETALRLGLDYEQDKPLRAAQEPAGREARPCQMA